ncbi:MAG: hypothetical protein AB8Y83_00460 [Coxiella endosymbiont of Haemaphysalis qinghaiensis]
MPNVLRQLWESIVPIVGMIVFVILFIVGIFLFSYLLIIGAIIGLILFVIAFIQLQLKTIQWKQQKKKKSPYSGRTIEHNDNF